MNFMNYKKYYKLFLKKIQLFLLFLKKICYNVVVYTIMKKNVHAVQEEYG